MYDNFVEVLKWKLMPGVCAMGRVVYASIVTIFLVIGCTTVPEGAGTAPVSGGHHDRQTGESRDECLRSIRRARSEARGGLYRLYVYREESQDARFSRFLVEYLRSRYGIELVMYGDDAPDRDRCYSNEMEKIIMNTFGPGILSEAEEEAREIFRSPER